MDFGKYIHELLLENDIVIIPGFGAFVSEYKPAEINDNSGEIKPPSKSVSFNPQIRNNDGLLVGYVAENKRISHFDALKRIEKEREDILYKLDSGEKVEIDEVGVLFFSEDQTITFAAEEDENLLLDSFGLEATTIVAENKPMEEEQLVTPQVVAEPEKTENPAVEEESPEVKEIQKEEEHLEQTPEEAAPIPVSDPEYKTLKNKEEPEEKKKKRAWLWMLLMLIPLIAVSVFIFMKGYDDGKSAKTKESSSEIKIIEQPAIVVQDTAKADSVIIVAKDTVSETPKDTIVAEEINRIAAPDADTPKYYLVGGSFSIKENAETYLKELKDKGFDAFHVGKKGRFFIVGIGTYDSFGEAEKAKQDFMKNNPASEVWVWKK